MCGTLLGVALTASAQTLPPPNGNVPAPINVGSAGQYKEGTLRIGSTGTATAGAKLDVIGVSSTQGFANFGTSELLGHVHIGTIPCFDSNGLQIPCPASASLNSHLGLLAPVKGIFGLLGPKVAYAVPNSPTGTTSGGTTSAGSTTGVNPGTTGVMTNGSTGVMSSGGGSSYPATISSILLDVDGNTSLNGSSSLYVGGRIGLGTGAPDSKLGIYSSNSRSGLTIASGTSNWMQVYQPYNVGQLRIGQGSFANNSVSDIATFQASGEVGIGTTTPGTKLDVVGGTEPLYTRNSSGGGYTFMGYSDNGNYGRIGAYNNGWKPLVLNEGGRVGIGTTNPAQKLDVNGAAIVRSDGYPGTNGILYLGDGSNYVRSVYGGGLRLSAYGNTDGVVLAENGNVGIGKSSPNQKLDVNGAIYADNLYLNSAHLMTVYHSQCASLQFFTPDPTPTCMLGTVLSNTGFAGYLLVP